MVDAPIRTAPGALLRMSKLRPKLRTVRLALISAVWMGYSGLASTSALAAGADAKEAELKQVRGRIESIRKSIHAEAQRRDALSGQVRSADLQIQTARERLAAIRARRAAAEKRLAELRNEQTDTERRIRAERQSLAAELNVAYMNGRQEQLKLLLNQVDPAQLGRMAAYYGYFSRARAERITAIGEHLEHLELLAENIAAETEKLKTIEEERAGDVKALAGARERRAQTLAQVQSRIKTRNDELAKLQREARALERLVEELRRAIEEFPELAEQPFQRVKGKLPWPVKGKLLARFGQLRSGGPLKWQGVVIGAQRGSQVRAPYHGRVVYADWLPGLGMLVVLDHGGGYMSLYGHNEQLYRRVGDRVSPGDVLAVVGDAAGMGEPGLYLEIRKGKQALDPAGWLIGK
ncbi:MAG: murein hydrolase activator EnvC family protein [Steroidobacter sp.]